MWGTRTISPKIPFSCYATVGWTQLDTSCPSVRRPSGVLVRRTYRPIYHRGNRPNDTLVRVNNLNSSSVQFAMYHFSKCRFALLMRTRLPTLNLGVPTLRDHTIVATRFPDWYWSFLTEPYRYCGDRCRCTIA